MALDRKHQKIFGANAQETDLGVVGSKNAGNPQYSTDIETLQSLSNWGTGLRALVTSTLAPYLQDQNSILYVITSQLAYLFQAGLAEWHSQTEYVANRSAVLKNGKIYIAIASSTNIEPEVASNWGAYWKPFSSSGKTFFDTDFVSHGGSYAQGDILLYTTENGCEYKIKSIVANNTNAPTPSNIRISSSEAGTFYWQLVSGIMPSIILAWGSTIIPDGWLLCDGSEVLKTTYAFLYRLIGDTYGVASDNTKFKLPDFRNKTYWGGDTTNVGTVLASALPNIKGSMTNICNRQGSASGALSFSSASGNNRYASNSVSDLDNVNFNAHNSNSIYKDGQTIVQPPAIQVPFIIKY